MKKNNSSLLRVKLVFTRTLYSQSSASLTMGSLAAYLRSSGFQVDLCLLDEKNLLESGSAFGESSGHDVVIAKPNFKDFREMFSLLERLKKGNLIKRVFLCGPFAKRNATDLLSRLAWVDGVLMDQLEPSALGLISTMSADYMSWDFNVPGVISRNTKTFLTEGHQPLFKPIMLSELPFPARDVERDEDVSFVNIEGSRGCLFSCSFCHIPLMFEIPTVVSQLNVRDPIKVVDEIERLNREMGKTLFIFNDSCFWSTKKDDDRIFCFCREIKKRNLDVHFYVYLKGEPFIGDELLSALASAGLVRVFLGVENSVKTSLATYRKKVRPDLYETVKAKLDKLGINIHIGYITIEPYSSLDDVLSNVEYLFRIGKLFRFGVILEPVRVVPGSSLHRKLVDDCLMHPTLGYDEVTYGYRFSHPEVGQLLAQWKSILQGQIKDVAYEFEYYSTTGELLRVLAERIDPAFVGRLQESYLVFNALKLQGMNVLLGYFRSSIQLAREGRTHTIGNQDCDRDFSRQFTGITKDLGFQHGSIISLIRHYGGERIIREVYPK